MFTYTKNSNNFFWTVLENFNFENSWIKEVCPGRTETPSPSPKKKKSSEDRNKGQKEVSTAKERGHWTRRGGHNNCQPGVENDSICRAGSPDIEALTVSPGSVRTPEKDRSVGFGSREHPHHWHISGRTSGALCSPMCVHKNISTPCLFPQETPTSSKEGY
ncbi:hypothetical protein CEXT_651681 [Caerostris extrusa]|uniref:Uncharacterized protein n=1 Tax=Caerostris extrusa TaxID=172846 RepID=A0AAV4X9A2_CAEEX|nr:hypothetical protein CEXT_651681 [Caerostris extrusa]